MERIFQLLTVIGCVAVCLGVVRIYIHIDCFKLFVCTMNNENQFIILMIVTLGFTRS